MLTINDPPTIHCHLDGEVLNLEVIILTLRDTRKIMDSCCVDLVGHSCQFRAHLTGINVMARTC